MGIDHEPFNWQDDFWVPVTVKEREAASAILWAVYSVAVFGLGMLTQWLVS